MLDTRREKILIVDDDLAMRQLLAAILHGEYQLAAVDSGEAALNLLDTFQPGLVLLDLLMPGIDGLETCRRIRSTPCGRAAHVVIVSGRSSKREQSRAYAAGADDYVVKPIEPHEFKARVRLHFRLRNAASEMAASRAEVENLASNLNRLAEASEGEIHATQDAAVLALAKVAECRDDHTGGHLLRIRSYSQILAQRLSLRGPYARQIDGRFLDDLYRSSMLHDIGKVGIADAILLKPGRLTSEEFDRMKQHAVIGANMLERVMHFSRAAGFLAMAAVVARFHHEKFDGNGYPAGLKGEAIPLPARIVALADVYDALTSDRPYKTAWTPDEARREIEAQAGRHFDPVVVAAFQDCFEEFRQVRSAEEEHQVHGAMFVPEGLTSLEELSPDSLELAGSASGG
jgi:putative two-component system response regulator